MTEPHDEPHVRLQLGAYVLGSLTPEEDEQTAGHLQHCTACQVEYLEMEEARNLLAMITEADLLDAWGEESAEDGGRGDAC
ncbi:zf-HC2 domain-containing protein [Streptomyces sp. NPDC002520]